MSDEKVKIDFVCTDCGENRHFFVSPDKEEHWINLMSASLQNTCYSCVQQEKERKQIEKEEAKKAERKEWGRQEQAKSYYNRYGGYDWNNKDA